jgi:hypothetical protein
MALRPRHAVETPRHEAFRFQGRRGRIDWLLVSDLDPARLVKERDISALERVLDTLAFGDVTVEDPHVLSGAWLRGHAHAARRAGSGVSRAPAMQQADWVPPAGGALFKLFRLAQLTIEYLLFVQARNCVAGAPRRTRMRAL